MIRSRLFLMIISALFSCGGVIAARAEPAIIYTAIISPYITEAAGGKGAGLILEIMTGALGAAGVPYQIKDAQPWRRAQSEAIEQPGSLVSPFARTPVREPDWSWISILLDEKMYIYVPAGAAKPNNQEELLKVASLGALAGGAPESIAKELGLVNVMQTVPSEQQNAIKTSLGRIEAWMSQGYMAAAGMREAGVKPATIDQRFVLRDLPLWVATSKKTDPAMVATLRQAFESFRVSPAYAQLLKRYQ